jgi:YVTN family beta-propeller protein
VLITFNEDAQDGQHPAQRTPTIILGSAGVRPGYVSPVRYTHYSLLRTIEAALGLGTLTASDRYAQPVNGHAREPGQPPGREGDTATRRQGRAIKVGTAPVALTITPNGSTVYVVSEDSSTVTPIAIATNRPGSPPHRRRGPPRHRDDPGGRIAYVLNWVAGSVTPIDTATGDALAPIPVGSYPVAIAMSPGPARQRRLLARRGGRLRLAGVRREQHRRDGDAADYLVRPTRFRGQRRHLLLSHRNGRHRDSPVALAITG